MIADCGSVYQTLNEILNANPENFLERKSRKLSTDLHVSRLAMRIFPVCGHIRPSVCDSHDLIGPFWCLNLLPVKIQFQTSRLSFFSTIHSTHFTHLESEPTSSKQTQTMQHRINSFLALTAGAALALAYTSSVSAFSGDGTFYVGRGWFPCGS